METQQDVIKNFMRSLDNTGLGGREAMNEAIKNCCGVESIQAAIDIMVSDCQSVGNAESFLQNRCGITLYNDDTGAITGSDAGGATVKTSQSIIPENGDFDPNFYDNSFGAYGLTFQLVGYPDTDDYYNHYYSTDVSSLTDSQRLIWQALYSWWGKESLYLIAQSYGDNFGFDAGSSATVKNIHVGFGYDNSGSLATTSTWTSDNNVTDLDLRINTYYYGDINNTDPNGSANNNASAGYLDRVIAHELTHAVMAANINNFYLLPSFIQEGMAELTHGIDDWRTSTLLELAGDASKLSSALNVDNYSYADTYAYAGGYMFLRYLAKQESDAANSAAMNIQPVENNMWFAEENNFVSADNLSEIVENNFSAVSFDKIENNNFENLSAENNFVTYTE